MEMRKCSTCTTDMMMCRLTDITVSPSSESGRQRDEYMAMSPSAMGGRDSYMDMSPGTPLGESHTPEVCLPTER